MDIRPLPAHTAVRTHRPGFRGLLKDHMPLFPAAAVAWRISKEQFFKLDWIWRLKIRASYGQLGIKTPWLWEILGLINKSYSRAIYGARQIPQTFGQYQAQITDPNLHWKVLSKM